MKSVPCFGLENPVDVGNAQKSFDSLGITVPMLCVSVPATDSLAECTLEEHLQQVPRRRAVMAEKF